MRRQKSNPEIATGEVEVIATGLHLLNTSKTPPFQIEDEITANEETRLRYRYLDLRRPKPHRNLELRHRIILEIRKTLDELGFFEVETPMLTRSTPEGARDYLVPSRIHHGQFYALAAIAANLQADPDDFRPGPLFPNRALFPRRRLSRRPPTRIHPARPGNVLPAPTRHFRNHRARMERACAVVDVQAKGPFRHLDYQEALRRFGSDKPDLRFGMELHNVTEFFEAGRENLQIRRQRSSRSSPGRGHVVAQATRRAWRVREISRRKRHLHSQSNRRRSHFAAGKNLGAEKLKKLAETVGAKPGDLIVAVSGQRTNPA